MNWMQLCLSSVQEKIVYVMYIIYIDTDGVLRSMEFYWNGVWLCSNG